jgi:hypothetical protein
MGLCCFRVTPRPTLAPELSLPVQELRQTNLDFVDNAEDGRLIATKRGSGGDVGPSDEAILERMLAEVDELSD